MHQSCFPIPAAAARSPTAFQTELVKEIIKYDAPETHAGLASGKRKSALQNSSVRYQHACVNERRLLAGLLDRW